MSEPEDQSPSVRYAVEEGVSTVALARPKYHNAQSVRLVYELDAALRRARGDEEEGSPGGDEEQGAIAAEGNGSGWSATRSRLAETKASGRPERQPNRSKHSRKDANRSDRGRRR